MILQSIVLLGAISFKKYALIKTALSVGAFFALVIGMAMLSIRLFYPNYFLFFLKKKVVLKKH